MSDYYWDSQIEYLRNTRSLYYNDDYLEFLVQKVWRINEPVKIADFGCGYGYLGLKLLPLLPKGSTYTGIDKGKDLIGRAREVFADFPFQTEFIVADFEEVNLDCEYDIAVCHAFLLHMKEPTAILLKMIQSVVDGGRIICFEPHWIANMANYQFNGLDQSTVIQLGVLQKLFEEDARQGGKDGNVGMNVPILLSQLGLKNVQCRVSDKVNFLDQNMEMSARIGLYQSLRAEGIGHVPSGKNEVISNLTLRGLTCEEAEKQYEAELRLSRQFSEDSWLTYAPNMKITYGCVQRDD